jgi:type I restriction enzyme S subunit
MTNMETELPAGWAKATLGDVASEPIQHVPAADETFSYIDIGSIDRTAKVIRAPQRMLGKDAPSRARKKVAAGDTLVSLTRPNLNAVALVPQALNGQIASTGFDVLRPAHGIDPRWLAYLVRTEEFVRAMSDVVQGALYPAVRTKDVRSFTAPLAPAAEQTRITDQLDTLLSRIQACQDRLEAIPALLKQLRAIVLASAFNGKLTQEWRAEHRVDISTWKSKTVGEIAEVGTGSTPLRTNSSFYSDIGTPWITSAATGSPYIDSAQQRVTTAAIIANRLKVFPPGTLLVAMYGEGKTRGQVSELRMSATINQACAAIEVDPKLANVAFVKLALWSQYEKTRGLAEGGAQPNLNLSKVRGISINLPSAEEQDQIVRKVGRLFSITDRIEARVAAAAEGTLRLTPLVLAKAFRGDLVPQDPHDEHASTLLEKIKASRTNNIASSSQSRPKIRGKRLNMSDTDKETIKAAILQLRTDRFTFDELRAQVSADYENLKEVLFDLLQEPSPVIRQVFDEQTNSMQLVRVFL